MTGGMDGRLAAWMDGWMDGWTDMQRQPMFHLPLQPDLCAHLKPPLPKLQAQSHYQTKRRTLETGLAPPSIIP